jgi:hypothetical protein
VEEMLKELFLDGRQVHLPVEIICALTGDANKEMELMHMSFNESQEYFTWAYAALLEAIEAIKHEVNASGVEDRRVAELHFVTIYNDIHKYGL